MMVMNGEPVSVEIIRVRRDLSIAQGSPQLAYGTHEISLTAEFRFIRVSGFFVNEGGDGVP